ncbi:MAG: acylphosphatase [bacterium]
MKRHVHLKIMGRVQGVWFRASTKEIADKLGIKGWVRNLPDGSVEVDATGNADAIEEFIQWCHKGPPGARVTDVSIEYVESMADYTDFKIIR